MLRASFLLVLAAAGAFLTCASAATQPAGSQPASARGPAAAALEFVKTHAGELGLTASDVGDVVVSSEARSEHTGVTHVYLRQRYRGIDVWSAEMTVNVARDGAVVSHAGRFVPRLEASRPATSPALTPVQAAQAAARHVELAITEPIRIVRDSRGPARETLLSSGGIAAAGIPAKLALYPTASSSIRLAWVVEIEERSAQHSWVVLVDAETGALLEKTDRVVA